MACSTSLVLALDQSLLVVDRLSMSSPVSRDGLCVERVTPSPPPTGLSL